VIPAKIVSCLDETLCLVVRSHQQALLHIGGSHGKWLELGRRSKTSFAGDVAFALKERPYTCAVTDRDSGSSSGQAGGFFQRGRSS
jgi:hypothetical protein